MATLAAPAQVLWAQTELHPKLLSSERPRHQGAKLRTSAPSDPDTV